MPKLKELSRFNKLPHRFSLTNFNCFSCASQLHRIQSFAYSLDSGIYSCDEPANTSFWYLNGINNKLNGYNQPSNEKLLQTIRLEFCLNLCLNLCHFNELVHAFN